MVNLVCGGGVWFLSALTFGVFSLKLRLLSDQRQFSTIDRKSMENIIQDLAKKMGIKKTLEVKEVSTPLIAQAMGNSFLPGKAGVLVNPEFYVYLSVGEREFVMAHEIAHIENNDMLLMPIVAGLVGLITTVALSILFPPLAIVSPVIGMSPAALTGFVVSLATIILFSRWREACADSEGFLHCSAEGKAGALLFFKNLQERAIAHRNEDGISFLQKLWRKFTITKEGDMRTDVLHPSFSRRIQNLQGLQRRSPVIA